MNGLNQMVIQFWGMRASKSAASWLRALMSSAKNYQKETERGENNDKKKNEQNLILLSQVEAKDEG